MQKRGSTLTSAKFAQRRKQRERLLILAGVLLVELIFWGVISLAQAGFLTIQSVQVNGNQAVAAADIQTLVEGKLEGVRLYFFPVNSVFWYPRRQIEAAVLAEWPRIESTQMNVRGLFSGTPALSVTVSERQPVALWCGGQQLFNSQDCYYMDKDAFIFERQSASSTVQLPNVGDSLIQFFATSTPANPIGSTYLGATEFSKIMQFVSVFQNDLGLQPQSVIALGENDFELTLTGGSEILFHDTDDPVQVSANLRIFLQNNDLAFAVASSTLDFSTSSVPIVDYIDLRYGTNIYYKTQDGISAEK